MDEFQLLDGCEVVAFADMLDHELVVLDAFLSLDAVDLSSFQVSRNLGKLKSHLPCNLLPKLTLESLPAVLGSCSETTQSFWVICCSQTGRYV